MQVILAGNLVERLESRKALDYLAVQFFGGIVAALTLAAVLGETSNLGQTTLAPEVSVWQGLLVETLLTFFLVNTIFNTAVSGKAGLAAGAAIGLTLTFAILMGGQSYRGISESSPNARTGHRQQHLQRYMDLFCRSCSRWHRGRLVVQVSSNTV